MNDSDRTDRPPTPELGRTNPLAIIGLVLSLIGAFPFGLWASTISLRQIKVTHEGGRELALAGVGIGLIGLCAFLSILVQRVFF